MRIALNVKLKTSKMNVRNCYLMLFYLLILPKTFYINQLNRKSRKTLKAQEIVHY